MAVCRGGDRSDRGCESSWPAVSAPGDGPRTDRGASRTGRPQEKRIALLPPFRFSFTLASPSGVSSSLGSISSSGSPTADTSTLEEIGSEPAFAVPRCLTAAVRWMTSPSFIRAVWARSSPSFMKSRSSAYDFTRNTASARSLLATERPVQTNDAVNHGPDQRAPYCTTGNVSHNPWL